MTIEIKGISPGDWRVVEGVDLGGWIRIDAGPQLPNGDPDWIQGGETLIDESFELWAMTEEAQDEVRANFTLWGASKALLGAAKELDEVLGMLIPIGGAAFACSDNNSATATAIIERIGAFKAAIVLATTIPPKPDYQPPED